MLSVPMVLEMAMESLFAVVDVFFVSKVSADAVATVGVTESMLTIVYTVALGLGIGATAVVSRRMGEKDDEGAAQASAQSIALGLAVAAAVGVAGVLNAERLMRLMGATPSMGATGFQSSADRAAGERRRRACLRLEERPSPSSCWLTRPPPARRHRPGRRSRRPRPPPR